MLHLMQISLAIRFLGTSFSWKKKEKMIFSTDWNCVQSPSVTDQLPLKGIRLGLELENHLVSRKASKETSF